VHTSDAHDQQQNVLAGNLLADLAEINHAANYSDVEKLEKVQHAVDFMSSHDVPKRVQVRIEWCCLLLVICA